MKPPTNPRGNSIPDHIPSLNADVLRSIYNFCVSKPAATATKPLLATSNVALLGFRLIAATSFVGALPGIIDRVKCYHVEFAGFRHTP